MKTAAVLPLIAVLAVNAKLRPSAPVEQISADDALMVRPPIYTDPIFDPIGDPSTYPIRPHGPFKPPMKIPPRQLEEETTETVADDDELIIRSPIRDIIDPFNPPFDPLNPPPFNPHGPRNPFPPITTPTFPFPPGPILRLYEKKEEATEPVAEDDELIIRSPIRDIIDPFNPPFDPLNPPFDPLNPPFNPHGPLKPFPFPPGPIRRLDEKKEEATEPVAEDDELIVRHPIRDLIDPFNPLGPGKHFPIPIIPTLPTFPTRPILNLYEKHLPPYVETLFPVEDEFGGPIVSVEEEVTEAEPVESGEVHPIICHLPPPEEAYIDEPEMVIDPINELEMIIDYLNLPGDAMIA